GTKERYRNDENVEAPVVALQFVAQIVVAAVLAGGHRACEGSDGGGYIIGRGRLRLGRRRWCYFCRARSLSITYIVVPPIRTRQDQTMLLPSAGKMPAGPTAKIAVLQWQKVAARNLSGT